MSTDTETIHAPHGCRHGKCKVAKMYAQINTLRHAIRTEGTEAIQDAWDAVEEHIDFIYQEANQ